MSRILVVDDEVPLLKLMETYLKRQGHEVVCCGTGSEGLEALDQADNPFDVAVLDHWLPDMGGMELLAGVVVRCPDLRILVSSGSLMDVENLGLPSTARVAFLQKPYLPKMLTQAVAELLER
jgi:CheY-like chemotaxis protein